MDPAPSKPVPLDSSFDLSAFDCGSSPLNEYLRKYALLNQQNRAARTYISTRGARVVGFYTLAAGSVDREEAPPRISKGLSRHPIPIILLARLAVDRGEQSKGLGGSLLKDALIRRTHVGDLIGCRAVFVHAKDEKAEAFYRKYGFEPSPRNKLQLYLLMKDIQQTLSQARRE